MSLNNPEILTLLKMAVLLQRKTLQNYEQILHAFRTILKTATHSFKQHHDNIKKAKQCVSASINNYNTVKRQLLQYTQQQSSNQQSSNAV